MLTMSTLPSPFLTSHVQPEPKDVCLKNRAKRRGIRLDRCPLQIIPRIIHQDRNRADALAHSRNHRVHVVELPNVERLRDSGFTDRGTSFPQCCFSASHEDDFRAGLRHAPRDSQSQPRTASRDDRNFAIETKDIVGIA